MTHAIELKPTESQAASPKAARKARKPVDVPSPASNTRYFIGETDEDGRICMTTEFDTELEARLASFRLDQSYYELGSWKAVANLGQGSIAVERVAVTGKGAAAGSGQVQKSHHV